jgi:hypothetical protein
MIMYEYTASCSGLYFSATWKLLFSPVHNVYSK